MVGLVEIKIKLIEIYDVGTARAVASCRFYVNTYYLCSQGGYFIDER